MNKFFLIKQETRYIPRGVTKVVGPLGKCKRGTLSWNSYFQDS